MINKQQVQLPYNQSSDRLLQIIENLASNKTSMRLQDISDQLSMPQSTVLRYLKTLSKQGYVCREENTGNYMLTWKLCGLAERIQVNFSIRTIISPFLNSIARKLNVGACIVIPNNNDILYLDVVDKAHTVMRTLKRIGRNAPIYSTASGKVLLSSFSNRQVHSIIEKTGLVPVTEMTITDKNELLDQLEKVKANGYAIDNEECEIGIRCISVPIYDYTENVAAAFSVYDEVEYMQDEHIKNKILPEMLKTAKEISFRMGSTKDYGNTNKV